MSFVRSILALVASVMALVLALPVLVLWAPFRAVAGLTPILARFLEPAHARWPDLMRFDPVLGWRPRAELDARYLTDVDPEVFRLVTDRDGWPGTGTVEEARVVVVGDSWAMGYAVAPERGFAALLRDMGVKAVGCNGYNLVQELLLIRELGEALAGKTVVWLIYQGNDLHENLLPFIGSQGYPAPFVRESEADDGGWEIVTHHVREGNWGASRVSTGGPRQRGVMEELHSDTHLARRAFEACGHLLSEGKRHLDRLGAEVVVVGLPHPVGLRPRTRDRWIREARDPSGLDPQRIDRELGALCEQLGVPYVAARERLEGRHFRPSDDHLTEAGHEVLAGLIREAVGRSNPRGRTAGVGAA